MSDIPRLEAPDAASLLAHARSGTPALITHALGGPLAEVRDREAATAFLGQQRFRFRPEYVGALHHRLVTGEEAPPTRELSFRDYWHHVDADPATPLMCVEEATPPELAALAPAPACCSEGSGGIKSTVFIGNAGNHANLHFDGDCRHVLLHQIFGRKHVVVLPASAAGALRPVVNFSSLQLQRLDDDERATLLQDLGGWETVLEPGDAILMPALVWHGVRYLDHGMSVNWRFGRHHYHDLISQHLHLSAATQRIASETLEPTSIEGEQRDRWCRLLDQLAEPWHTPRQLRDRIEAALDRKEKAAPPFRPDAYLALPPVVREGLERLHLFQERLYVPEMLDLTPWRP